MRTRQAHSHFRRTSKPLKSKYLTVSEAADYLRVSEASIRRWLTQRLQSRRADAPRYRGSRAADHHALTIHNPRRAFMEKRRKKMTIYKRGSIYWYEFWFRGRRIQESARVANRSDARDIEAARRTQLARGEVGLDEPKTDDRTVRDVLDALEEHFKAGGKRSGKPYGPRDKSNFKRARAVFPTNPAAAALTTENFEQVIKEKQRERIIAKKRRKSLRPATINRITGLIAEALRHAKITPPEIRHLSEKGNARPGFFEPADFARLLQHLPDDFKDFCRFAYATGWRKGEISSLEWSDVQGDTIYLRGTKSKNGESRSLPLDGDLPEIVERRRAVRHVRGALVGFARFQKNQPRHRRD